MRASDLKSAIEKEEEGYLLLDVREADEVSDEPYFQGENPHYVNLPLSVLGMIPKERR